MPGYLKDKQIRGGVVTLKKYLKKRSTSTKKPTKKDLLAASDDNPLKSTQFLVEVVFKNVPENSKTFIHTIQLPHHWRLTQGPEDSDIVLFVPHRRADNEAQAIQFAKDRDLDIDNTHTYYKELLESRLDESLVSRISRIITTKELATEFSTPQKLDRLSKSYDLFLSDKKLMSNKMNSLPRRLGRRFWVREKKVPLMIKLDAKNLNERLTKVLATEPFYVTGRSSTERIQVGLASQNADELVENIKTFLDRLYELYGDSVRFIRFRGNAGLALPIFADLSLDCPVIRKTRKPDEDETIVDDFDFLDDDAKVSISKDGTVKVIKSNGTLYDGDEDDDDDDKNEDEIEKDTEREPEVETTKDLKAKRKLRESPAVDKRKKKIKK